MASETLFTHIDGLSVLPLGSIDGANDYIVVLDDSASALVKVAGSAVGNDADAIHDNVAGEIAALTEKASPVSADLLVIEDSADSNNKKKVQIGNLPGGGGATGYLWLPATVWGIDGTYPTSALTVRSAGAGNIDSEVYDFDPSTIEFVHTSIVMPSDWDLGDLDFSVYWTADSGSGAVVWALQGGANGDGDVLGTNGTPRNVTDTLQTAGDVHVATAASAMVLSGTPAAGDLVQLWLGRVADDGADTLGVDARFIGLRVSYGKS